MSSSRETTPPSNTEDTLPPSAYVAPELAHTRVAEEPTPEDALPRTSSTSDEEVSTSAEPLTLPLGVTGIDMSQVIYDGTSENNADHFISIEDESMERMPDVRPYFWKLGQLQMGHRDIDRPQNFKDRIAYDDQLVKEGREVLKRARKEQRGYFLSERRYLLDHNTPQDPWYCMPAASVILTSPFRLAGHVYEDEGVYCGEPDLDHFLEDMILTNIRAPIIFAKYVKYLPGTAQWDDKVCSLYSPEHFIVAGEGGQEPWEIVWDQALDEWSSIDSEAVEAMLRKYWPVPPSHYSPFGDTEPNDWEEHWCLIQ